MTALTRVDPRNPYAAELVAVRRRLTPAEIVFVEELMVDLDHERAAEAAGFPPKRGKSIAKRHYVDEAITLLRLERSERLDARADKVVGELAKLAFASLGDFIEETPEGDPYLTLKGVDKDRRDALSEVQIEDFLDGRGEDARQVRRIKFKLHDKKAALDSLARHNGMFVDRVEHSGEIELKILNMTRAERLKYAFELLRPMQRYLTKGELENESLTIEGEIEKATEDDQGSA